MRDDWRLIYEFAEEDDAERFAVEAEAVLAADSEVSRADRLVYVYPDVEADARDAERALSGVTVQPRTTRLERWNPGEQEWQDPALPVPQSLPFVDASLVDLDGAEWIVEAQVPRGTPAIEAWESLWRTGLLVVPLPRGRKAVMSAHDEAEADQLCAEIEGGAPFVRARTLRLTRLRRWWLAQHLYGNYKGATRYWHNQPHGWKHDRG